MKIQIYLNKEHPSFVSIQKELSDQLASLKTIEFSKESSPAQPGTLGLPSEVVGFLAVYHKELIGLVPSLIDLLSYIVRRMAKAKKRGKNKISSPVLVLAIGNTTLNFPSSPTSQKRFVSKLVAKRPAKK